MSLKALFVLLLLSIYLGSTSQIVEKASLMKITDAYGDGNQPHLFKSLKNGSKVLTGRLGSSMHYKNWEVNNADSLLINLKYYIALFSSDDSLLWVKYMNAHVHSVESDSKNNIYLTGTYKGLLHTSDGDTLPLLSNNTNHFGNVFIIKLDSAGHKKWWKTSDNEASSQSEPYGDYIKIDPDFNVYIAGHYHTRIRFSDKLWFTWVGPNIGYTSFLAKLDSSGNYNWIRDWAFDTGLPGGLSIDSCRIYMYTTLGASQTHLRIRKYDFAGKLLDTTSILCNTALFWANNVNVKDDRLVMISREGNQNKIGYYNLNGNLLWSINISGGLSVDNLGFTQNNKIFFSGQAFGDTNKIGTTTIPGNIYWGFMDTIGTVLSVKSIPKVKLASLPTIPYLTENGKLYFNAVVDYYSTSNSSTFTLDTITFNNLTYYDPVSGIISGKYYRLLAEYSLTEGYYFNPGNCTFSPPVDTCLNREGLFGCTPGMFTLAVNPLCNGTLSQIKLSWTPSSHAANFDIYRGGSLYAAGISGSEFIDSVVTSGNSYSYTVKAKNVVGSVNNSNGILSATARNCSVTSVISIANNPFEIKVFPNPSNGEYFLNAKRVSQKTISIEVLNVLGQVIYSTQQKSLSNDFSKPINIAKAPNGLYFLKISVDKKSYFLPITKH